MDNSGQFRKFSGFSELRKNLLVVIGRKKTREILFVDEIRTSWWKCRPSSRRASLVNGSLIRILYATLRISLQVIFPAEMTNIALPACISNFNVLFISYRMMVIVLSSTKPLEKRYLSNRFFFHNWILFIVNGFNYKTMHSSGF